jgi:hypothetical protein
VVLESNQLRRERFIKIKNYMALALAMDLAHNSSSDVRATLKTGKLSTIHLAIPGNSRSVITRSD